jgi:hypothetical protein
MNFSLGRFSKYHMCRFYQTIMVCHFSLQKSSANYLAPHVFVGKGFDISIFGHFFCPIPENFLTLVQSKFKK